MEKENRTQVGVSRETRDILKEIQYYFLLDSFDETIMFLAKNMKDVERPIPKFLQDRE